MAIAGEANKQATACSNPNPASKTTVATCRLTQKDRHLGHVQTSTRSLRTNQLVCFGTTGVTTGSVGCAGWSGKTKLAGAGASVSSTGGGSIAAIENSPYSLRIRSKTVTG